MHFFPRKPKPVPYNTERCGATFFQGKWLPEEADSWEWDFFFFPLLLCLERPLEEQQDF